MQSSPPRRMLGPETLKGYRRRVAEGFIDSYLSGDAVLDIGYRGGTGDAQPITDKAIGVELDYPGYDGITLPFADASQDAVFVSHCLEHIVDYQTVLADWYRVLKTGGFLVIAVPHQYLYERKATIPSRFNSDHKRFYTPLSLLREIEDSLPMAGYRIRSMRDIDDGFDYAVTPDRAPTGSYEIELVVQKIDRPTYADDLVLPPEAEAVLKLFVDLLELAEERRKNPDVVGVGNVTDLLKRLPLPPFQLLAARLSPTLTRPELVALLRPVLADLPFDEADYLRRHKPIREAVEGGRLQSGRAHYLSNGYFEGRQTTVPGELFDRAARLPLADAPIADAPAATPPPDAPVTYAPVTDATVAQEP